MQKRQPILDYSIVTQVILLRPKAETTDHALATFFKADRLENCPAVGRRPLESRSSISGPICSAPAMFSCRFRGDSGLVRYARGVTRTTES